MQVKAKEMIFFKNSRRRPGTVFEVEEKDFNPKYMEKVDTSAAPIEQEEIKTEKPKHASVRKRTNDTQVI